VIVTPSQESEQQTKSTRVVYRGDLAEFMGRRGLKLIRRMDPKDIAKIYIDDHQDRERQGKAVPQLPDQSNWVSRIATQAKKIRQRMEEAAHQAPPSVA
jgi:hypothetical protein